jgi:hypothetical protein
MCENGVLARRLNDDAIQLPVAAPANDKRKPEARDGPLTVRLAGARQADRMGRAAGP